MKKIIWLYGLSGAGKTTIANTFVKSLENKSIVKLEGEDIRKIIYPNLGYTLDERLKSMDIIYKLVKYISTDDILIIVCTVSPPISYNTNIIKVYVKCPISVCIERDVKGLYKRVEKKLVENVYGLDLDYPKVENQDIILDTENCSIDECIDKLYKGVFNE